MIRDAYPRPNLKRNNWTNLNGEWDFGFNNNYMINNVNFDRKIIVPFVYQSKLSGINIQEDYEVVWYKKEFTYEKSSKNIMLHFGAVDYQAKVYLNGKYVGENEGGYLPFSFDVTSLIMEENELVVRVFDPPFDESIPRGKQYWLEKPEAIWYTRSTGIWQTVWLEEVNNEYVQNIKFTPNIDTSSVKCEFETNNIVDEMIIEIKKDGMVIVKDKYALFDTNINREINLLDSKIFRTNFHDNGWLWSPDNPCLFDVEVKLIKNGIVVDEVYSYFGMRKISYEKGRLYLNNKPYFLKLVLDQGYWPESLLSAPTNESFNIDITLAKQMGFNGCRKHQKIEDPNFLYECDKLGFVVWSEIAAAPVYNDKVVGRMVNEFSKMIIRDYNHPSIIVWVCLNESWSAPKIKYDVMQQAFSLTLYNIAKALDNTRLVISNDGWSMTQTDICAIHNYSHGYKNEEAKYMKFTDDIGILNDIMATNSSGHPVYANGFDHKLDIPIILSEFGGIALRTNDTKDGSWGYTVANSNDDFTEDLKRVMKAVYKSKVLSGFCYTQLTDVEQEINGLLNYDRTTKVDLEILRNIISK